jgi:CAAX prenyl protease-like protein
VPVDSRVHGWYQKHPSISYVAPFALFLIFLEIFQRWPIALRFEAPVRVLIMAAVCVFFWPADISFRPCHTLTSLAGGIAVFCIWIAPDVLFPGYRAIPLFSNSIVGHPHSSIPAAELQSMWVLAWRTVRAIAIVPVIEELFWRAWLMRWLVNSDFRKVPLGTYAPLAFWLTAILFACEHGPYWDVGFVAGLIYNSWMVRTKSVADCILMHAVTNAALSAYVIATHQWQYWL